MKKNLLCIQTLLWCLFFSSITYGQVCENFNTNLGSWQAENGDILHSSIADFDGTRYMRGKDDINLSWLYNTTYNAQTLACGKICYNYKVFNDGVSGSSPQMARQIRIYQGTIGNQTLAATFMLNGPITENSSWVSVCVPIQSAMGNQLPSNSQGQWTMNVGTAADWNTLIANYDGVAFLLDVAGSPYQKEKIGIDNFCVTNMPSPIPAFNFENVNGTPKTVFNCTEDVYMDGIASQNETHYFVDLWRRPIGSTGTFTAVTSLGWTSTPFNTILNLTQLFIQNGHTIEAGYEYSVKLAVRNGCNGWVELRKELTMLEAIVNPDFTYTRECGPDGTINITVTPVNPNSSHWWGVFETTTLGSISSAQTIGQVGSTQWGTTVTFTGLSRNKFYYVKHGAWNSCTPWQEKRIALPTGEIPWANITAGFGISGTSNFNGNVTVNTSANSNSVLVKHWWGIYLDQAMTTLVPGNAIQCCNSSTASWSNNLQVNVWYYVKHGIWNDCVGWREVRRAIRVQHSGKKGSDLLEIEVKEIDITDAAAVEEMNKLVQEGRLFPEQLNKVEEKELMPNEDNEKASDQLIISPNPIQIGDAFQIRTIDQANIQKVEVIDAQGQLQGVYQFTKTHRAEIQSKGLKSNELYLIRVVTDKGERMTGRVLMK